MSKPRPPYPFSVVGELFDSPSEQRRKSNANKSYYSGYHNGRGQRDGRRR